MQGAATSPFLVLKNNYSICREKMIDTSSLHLPMNLYMVPKLLLRYLFITQHLIFN